MNKINFYFKKMGSKKFNGLRYCFGLNFKADSYAVTLVYDLELYIRVFILFCVFMICYIFDITFSVSFFDFDWYFILYHFNIR